MARRTITIDEKIERQTAVVAKAKKKYDELSEQIAERETRRQNLQHFQETLESLKGTITEFDGALWGALVDYITVYEDGSRMVTFRDGTTI